MRPRFSGSRGGLGVTNRETPPFGSSGPWTPQLQAPAHGAMRPDPGHRTDRLPAAATTHDAGSDREMTLPVPNPGRESCRAGSLARWDIGPRFAQLWTHAYMTDWRLPLAGPLSGITRALEASSGWAGGQPSPSPTRTPAQAEMSRRRLRRGNRRQGPSADRLPPRSPRRETSNHRCWDVPAATGGPNPGHGCDASTHPIPTQGDPLSGRTPHVGAGRP